MNNEYNSENISSFLYSLILVERPDRILEVGAGHTTHFITKAIEDIQNQNTDHIDEVTRTELFYKKTKGYNPTIDCVDYKLPKNFSVKNVTFYEEDFDNWIDKQNKKFDFVFVDADGGQKYIDWFEKIFKRLDDNGIIIFHSTTNCLWGSHFVLKMKCDIRMNNEFEMITFNEPHKKEQSSFTVFKRKGPKPIWHIGA